MFEWISDSRASIALVVIIGLVAAFVWSIRKGLAETRRRAKDEVFGDPERTRGGWYWAVCGVSALMLVWFYYSWGAARAVFPKAANELCQVAKIDEALAPVSAALPITSRYLKSTTLVVRNRAQIEKLIGTMPVAALSASEQARLQQALDQTNSMISMLSDPASVDAATLTALGDIEQDILVLADRLAEGAEGMRPTADALAQPNWGTSEVEIPLLPMTPRGALFDAVSLEVVPIAERFLKIRNLSPELETAIASTAASLKELNRHCRLMRRWRRIARLTSKPSSGFSNALMMRPFSRPR